MPVTLARFVQANWLLIAFVLVLVAAFVFLRSPATRVASAQELDAMLTDGQPKIVEFYSDL
jgi:cbb3-type cytochrome oxidase subunit 3